MDEIKGIGPGKTMYAKDTKGLSLPGLYIDVKQEEKKKRKKKKAASM